MTEIQGIRQFAVAGFKSISREQAIEIHPLTILAGANSSGKSSMMQPLLLLKQTLEATFDPGPLLLNGPNVTFTSIDQLLSRTSTKQQMKKFSVSFDKNTTLNFHKENNGGISIDQVIHNTGFHPGMTYEELRNAFQDNDDKVYSIFNNAYDILVRKGSIFEDAQITYERCFLKIQKTHSSGSIATFNLVSSHIPNDLQHIIHLPGLRGNANRAYQLTGYGPLFPGTFEVYTATVIVRWQQEKQDEQLILLGQQLAQLGLASSDE